MNLEISTNEENDDGKFDKTDNNRLPFSIDSLLANKFQGNANREGSYESVENAQNKDGGHIFKVNIDSFDVDNDDDDRSDGSEEHVDVESSTADEAHEYVDARSDFQQTGRFVILYLCLLNTDLL